jgi:hypothetical protein
VSVALLRAQPALTRGRDPELLALIAMHAVRRSLFRILESSPEKLDDPDLPAILLGLVTGALGAP